MGKIWKQNGNATLETSKFTVFFFGGEVEKTANRNMSTEFHGESVAVVLFFW